MESKILLIRLGGLGDLLIILPALKLLRRFFPRSRFTLACRAEYGLLLGQAGLVEEVVDAGAGGLASLFSGEGRLAPPAEAWLKQFDQTWVWSLGQSGPSLEKALIRQGARSVHAVGPASGACRPLFQHYLDLTAEVLGMDKNVPAAEGAADRLLNLGGIIPAEGASGGEVVIHPGSGSRLKCWPFDRFLDVAKRLSENKIGGIFASGEAEAWLEPKLKACRLPSGWSWLPHPSLIDLARRLSSCRLYLGNDSGVTHLAAACGASGLALFRRDAEPLWRPYGRIRLLDAAEMVDIDTERAWEALGPLL